MNLKDILVALLQRARDINPVRNPHVIALQYGMPIQLDVRECVEPIERQDSFSASLECWCSRQRRPVGP